MPTLVDTISGYHKYLYDKVAFAVNTLLPNPIQFFTIPIGQGTSPTAGTGAKQIQDTNIDDGQKLPNPLLAFTLTSIRLQVYGNTATGALPTINDIGRLMRNYVGRLWISNKDYLDVPLTYIPGGGGVQYQGGLSTAGLTYTTTVFGGQSGVPSDTAKMQLSRYIKWSKDETFRFELWGSTFTTDITASTVLGQGMLIEVGFEGATDEYIAA